MKERLDEKKDEPDGDSIFVLTLFIAGYTYRSMRAYGNIKEICDSYLKKRYKLKVIDLYKKPHIAKEKDIVAAPTLLKTDPPPVRKIIGDLSNKERILAHLGIKRV